MNSYIKLTYLFFILIIIVSCDNKKNILTDLSSNNILISEAAIKKLNETKFNKKDIPYIYNAILKDYNDDNSYSIKTGLLKILWNVNDSTTPDFIKDIYLFLPDNIEIKFSALRVLSQMNTDYSTKIFIELLVNYQPDLDYNTYFVFAPYYENSGNYKNLFPSLFKLLENKNYKYDIYCLLIHFRNKGLLKDKDFLIIKDICLNDYCHYQSDRKMLNKNSIEYTDYIKMIEVLVGITSSFEDEKKISDMLYASLNDENPKIVLNTIISMVKKNKNIQSVFFEKTASIPETRIMLYEFLLKENKKDLFPSKYLTQFYFAESDMVEWLSFPMEFGRAPDRIELICEKEIYDKKITGRYFLFKYIYNDNPDGWMVGVSGPFPLKGELINNAKLTYSHFYKVGEISLDEHYNTFFKN